MSADAGRGGKSRKLSFTIAVIVVHAPNRTYRSLCVFVVYCAKCFRPFVLI